MADHPLRQRLNEELHSRPSIPVRPPARILHLALLDVGSQRLKEAFAAFCARHALPAPGPEARQAIVELGTQRLKWERHGEFGTLTLVGSWPENLLAPSLPAPALLEEITSGLGDLALAAADIRLAVDTEEPAAAIVERFFGHDDVAGAFVAGGTARLFTDFRIGPDGFTRYLVLDRGLTAARAGRTVRRLCEIDAYRMLALMAYPVAQAHGPILNGLEQRLHEILDEMARASGAAAERAVLERMTELSREVERLIDAHAFRFAAAKAYHRIVQQRLAELHEGSISGYQRPTPFLDRRLGPAMATCVATEERVESLARRLARAVDLLRTRIDVALEAQNQEILEGMAERTKAQLRLQETVEGLSVVAISYYALSVLAKVVEPIASHLFAFDEAVVLAILAPIVVLLVWLGMRRIRARIAHGG
ncbi:MAG: DUF3422 domain-containing protein [Geminicoccaceae bacterium]|nr:DUF3422 domain-containing protein [Geminicoccaceae bacterium]